MNTSLKSLLTFTLATSILATAGAQTIIPAAEIEKISGRMQYGAAPGSGQGALKFVDQSLPQQEVRVGPSNNDEIGLGYLIAFEFPLDAINELLMAEKVEFEVTVLKTAMGGAPSPLKVALLAGRGGTKAEHFAQFGAWNNAPDFQEIGTIDADPETGEIRFDVTEAVQNAAPPTSTEPMIFFAIYSPMEDLEGGSGGRHVIFGGEERTAPRLIISE